MYCKRFFIVLAPVSRNLHNLKNQTRIICCVITTYSSHVYLVAGKPGNLRANVYIVRSP